MLYQFVAGLSLAREIHHQELIAPLVVFAEGTLLSFWSVGFNQSMLSIRIFLLTLPLRSPTM